MNKAPDCKSSFFKEKNVEMQENNYLNCKESIIKVFRTMKVFRTNIAHSVNIKGSNILSKYL